jgi:hypothetical protein
LKEAVGIAVDEKSEVPADFACNICMGLVFDPYACNKYDKIFAKSVWATGKKNKAVKIALVANKKFKNVCNAKKLCAKDQK